MVGPGACSCCCTYTSNKLLKLPSIMEVVVIAVHRRQLHNCPCEHTSTGSPTESQSWSEPMKRNHEHTA
eukprot:4504686-Amphidinium_carterae.1